MTLKEIRDHRHKGPFRPLRFHLTSGATHLVEHPDFLFVPPVGDSFLIVSKEGNFHHIDANLVEEITVVRGGRKARSERPS